MNSLDLTPLWEVFVIVIDSMFLGSLYKGLAKPKSGASDFNNRGIRDSTPCCLETQNVL